MLLLLLLLFDLDPSIVSIATSSSPSASPSPSRHYDDDNNDEDVSTMIARSRSSSLSTTATTTTVAQLISRSPSLSSSSSVTNEIMSLNNKKNNDNNNNKNKISLAISNIDTQAFFSTPCASPFLLYGPKPQQFVSLHQATSSIKDNNNNNTNKAAASSSSSNNNNNNNNKGNVAVYKVLDLVHDNRALESLTYPEQWIYSLAQFVAEVFLMFDGRSTHCRIRHARAAIACFPSCGVSSLMNNKNSISNNNNNHPLAISFTELRVVLIQLADLDNPLVNFTPREKTLLNSRLPPKKHTTNMDVNENCSTATATSSTSSNSTTCYNTGFFDDNIVRLLQIIRGRVSSLRNGRYLRFAEFFAMICEMPLGVIPLQQQQQKVVSSSASDSAATSPFLPPPVVVPSLQGANSLFYGIISRKTHNGCNADIFNAYASVLSSSSSSSFSSSSSQQNQLPLKLFADQKRELFDWKKNRSICVEDVSITTIVSLA